MQSPDNPNCQRLTLPSDPTLWADMRDRPKYADKTKAQAAMLKVNTMDASRLSASQRRQAVIDPASGQATITELETDAYFQTLIARLVVAWNVRAPNGSLRPITADEVGELEPEDGDFLLAQAQKRLAGRARAEREDFTTPSSDSSPLGAATPATATPPPN